MWGCFGVAPKDRFFLENGGRVLEELVSLCDGKSNPIRTFSQKEIEKATNNYAWNQMLMMRAIYFLYEGTHDDYFITVKKFDDTCNGLFLKQCVNEIAITSHVNHKNVLKLLGCCLQTKIPVLVHEYCPNGSLDKHIYEDNSSKDCKLLSWQNRLRIAIEIADAVTYLHTATSKCIVHKNIKTKNILLDQNFVAKLSDFAFAVSISMGETMVQTDVVEGTCGLNLAPEYIRTAQVTEKNDVYNVGIVLVELLVGQRYGNFLINFDYASAFIEKNILPSEIVAATISKEGVIEQQLQAFARLALRCTENAAVDRPTMIQVAKELRRIKRFV